MPAAEHRAGEYAAVAHRRRLLRRIRTISLGIAAGAVVASLALGTAFARALPGHGRPSVTHAVQAPRPGLVPQSPAAPPSRPAGARRDHRHQEHRRLTPPASPPATTPASSPAPVSSGGS